jgi:hypothetical protein
VVTPRTFRKGGLQPSHNIALDAQLTCWSLTDSDAFAQPKIKMSCTTVLGELRHQGCSCSSLARGMPCGICPSSGSADSHACTLRSNGMVMSQRYYASKCIWVSGRMSERARKFTLATRTYGPNVRVDGTWHVELAVWHEWQMLT